MSNSFYRQNFSEFYGNGNVYPLQTTPTFTYISCWAFTRFTEPLIELDQRFASVYISRWQMIAWRLPCRSQPRKKQTTFDDWRVRTQTENGIDLEVSAAIVSVIIRSKVRMWCHVIRQVSARRCQVDSVTYRIFQTAILLLLTAINLQK